MIHLTRVLARTCVALALCAAALALRPAGAAAQGAPSDTTFYVLAEPTSYDPGCYDDCDCAVYSYPMFGSFRLVLVSVDPLYTNYLVDRFDATVTAAGGPIRFRGQGTYRIGGEVAITHQMTLDVEASGAPGHYDSGLVPGGAGFPRIEILLAAYAFACHDSVLNIDARPVGAAGVDDAPLASAPRAVPNPFEGATEIRFVQTVAGPLEASVFDARGRLARRLASRAWRAAGIHALEWDGRLEDGSAAPAGVYFARVRAPGKVLVARIVKLE